MEVTIEAVLKNIIEIMIVEKVKLDTVNVTKERNLAVINSKVYIDISNVSNDTFAVGLVSGEKYTLSTEENLTKVIELLKSN
ncbi:hypothetical protein BUY35_04930 [Staphylococcus cohnii]|nr:hypothetical protein BUY35_04930 [Staphylococcus cohnii]